MVDDFFFMEIILLSSNLLYWQLTCESFLNPDEWRGAFEQAGYTGDCGFIFFE